MSKTVKRLGRGKLVLALALAGLAVGGVAYAAIPSADGTISACYGKLTGNLRVIDAQAGESCRNSEQPLTWNQKGAKGDQGAPGAQGSKGDKGDPGGVSGYQEVYVQRPAPPGQFTSAKAHCPAGKMPTGGGVNTAHRLVTITSDRPIDNTWHGAVYNGAGVDRTIEVHALCADVDP